MTSIEKRDSLIETLKTINQSIADFADFTPKAREKRKEELENLQAQKIALNEELEKLELSIQEELKRIENERINASLQNFVSDFLSKNGISVSNWQEFINAYDSVSKELKKAKVQFTELSAEVLNTESENNAATIAGFFSSLSFAQKTVSENVFTVANKLTCMRLKQGNVKNAFIEVLQNTPKLIDSFDSETAQKFIKYIVSRTPVSKKSGNRKSTGVSMKSKVDNYLENLGEGGHSFPDFENWYQSEQEEGKTTTAISQLTFNCRADQSGKFALSKSGDTFTLTLR